MFNRRRPAQEQLSLFDTGAYASAPLATVPAPPKSSGVSDQLRLGGEALAGLGQKFGRFAPVLAGLPIAITAVSELGRSDGDLPQNVGGAAGSVAGGVGGGLLGAAVLGGISGGTLAPLGFALGSAGGSMLAAPAGRSIGGLFSESEVDKQIKDQRKLARAAYQMEIERTAAMDPTVQLQQARAMDLLQKQAYLQSEINGLDRFQQAMLMAPMQQFNAAPILQAFG